MGRIKDWRGKLMGRIKDWLMSMESLAEEAIANNFDEEEAVQFTALRDTLRDVYRNVKEQQEERLE